jgi:hypothetical protein
MNVNRFFRELAWPITDVVVPGDLDRALDAAARLDRDDLEKALAE